jgi:hypothetical protein
MKGKAERGTSLSTPEWYLNPPSDPGYIYAAGVDRSRESVKAIELARVNARVEIAKQVGTRISSLFKRFHGEAGGTEEDAVSAAVSEEAASVVLRDCRVVKQTVNKKGSDFWAYVLMEVAVEKANAAVVEKVRENEELKTRFTKSPSFRELLEKVDKH